jgi:hypothetical protein
MATHEIQQGEYLAKIAENYGFPDWKVIWDDPGNEDLRNNRQDPNVLYPGDKLYIPDFDDKIVSAATGNRHRFVLTRTQLKLKLVLADHDGKAIQSAGYTLKVGDQQLEGTTGSDGSLEELIPNDVEDGELTLTDLGITIPLKIGHLDPILNREDNSAIISGLQARLNNLGFYCGDVDGELGPMTTAALQAFQEKVMGREDADGNPDSDTLDKLLSEHGC